MPFQQGNRAAARLVFRAPPTPFGRSLIHCYTRKPAEMRGFLGMEVEMAFRSDPPGPRRARGVCMYNLTDMEMWPHPPYPLYLT